MQKKLVLFSLLSAVCCARPLYAFRPMMTEDTLFIGRDVRQVEAGLEHSVLHGGADRYSNALIGEISYGLFDNVDLLMNAPWRGWSANGVSESGPGDVSIEAKIGAVRAGGWDLVMKPGFSLPAGSEARSLGAGNGGAWLYGLAGRGAGPWQYYLNAGFLLNRNTVGDDENILKGSAAACYRALPELRVLGDVAVETDPDRRSSVPKARFLFGLVWSPAPTLDLDAGFKLGLTGPSEDQGVTAGLTLRL